MYIWLLRDAQSKLADKRHELNEGKKVLADNLLNALAEEFNVTLASGLYE
jgi:hypothetical protein